MKLSYMTLTFLTNLVNHHQINVADELYKRLGGNYVYVAFEPLPDWLKKGGYAEFDRPYILRAYESSNNQKRAQELADNSDVVIIGSASEDLVRRRLQQNKITFHYSERWFKTGYQSLFSPRAWYFFYKNHIQYRKKRSYMLCASAFTASDVHKIGAYPHKCFKWGYFTKVDEALDIEHVLQKKRDEHVKIMWCARFLKLKHPELPVLLARYLKYCGYDFELSMYGSGEECEVTQRLIDTLGVGDQVTLKGNLPNEEILHAMQAHHIFLFTSDRNEGWGAVLNEAMSNGCTVVGSNEIGSVPFLIQDGKNGCIFESLSLNSLQDKVEYLINHRGICEQYAREAYRSMCDTWSPRNAAGRLMKLINVIQEDRLSDYKVEEGPCSWAE